MARTPSTMLALGTPAPDFSLLAPATGRDVSLAEFKDAPALLVMFICNHCPYVKHIADGLAEFCSRNMERGVAVVGINSNDVSRHPDDAPDNMVLEAQARGYRFPYLYDGTQQVARAYRAACTPDFFLFDHRQQLVYRGQFDSSRPGNDVPIDGQDLQRAIDDLLAGRDLTGDQRPSLGCNIKWKPGNEPDYFARPA
ncbi:MAG: thioredoxin family protein [Pseudomonadota bacterium]